jgi:hypothetical protein
VSQQINLYQPAFRKQPKPFSARTLAQALGCVIAAIVAAYGYLFLQSGVLEIQARQSAQQLKSELERLKVSGGTSPAERLKLFADRKKAVEAAIAGRSQALEALQAGTLGQAEGHAKALRALARLSVEGVWLTRVEVADGGTEMSLAGRATRPELVARYVERLRADAMLGEQAFTGLEITRHPTYVEFKLSSGEREAKK